MRKKKKKANKLFHKMLDNYKGLFGCTDQVGPDAGFCCRVRKARGTMSRVHSCHTQTPVSRPTCKCAAASPPLEFLTAFSLSRAENRDASRNTASPELGVGAK